MKKIILLLSIILTRFSVVGQELQEVFNENIIVNSITSTSNNSSTRNYAEINLPKGTIGYTYRISVFPKQGGNVGETLLALLNKIPRKDVQLATQVARFALGNNNNNAIDFFIFNNIYNTLAFMQKKDGNYLVCRYAANRRNTCTYVSDCLNNKIYFGFRNNSLNVGVSVTVEVVAIVQGQRVQQNPNPQSNSATAGEYGSSGNNEVFPTKSELFGEWQDDNSLVEFRNNGTFLMKWQNGKVGGGVWSLEGDRLNLDFRNYPGNTYRSNDFYRILSWGHRTFKYQLINNSSDRTIYTAIKLKDY